MKSLLTLFFVTYSTLISGQYIFGIKGSYALSFSKSEEIKLDDELDFLLYKMRFIEQDISPSLSVFGRYKNDLVFLTAELSYRKSDFKFSSIDFLDYTNLAPEFETKTIHQLVLPLQAGLHLENIHFGVGPVFSLSISENQIFSEIEQFEERRRKFNAGFQYAITLDVYRLQVDLRFEQHFSGVGESFYFREDNKGFTNQSNLLVLGLAYTFPIDY